MKRISSTANSLAINFGKENLYPVISAVAIIGLWIMVTVGFSKMHIFPVFHDSPLFHYMAQQILDGSVPYRDFFDMNLPGIYFIHMIVLLLFGKSDTGWTMFTMLWLVLTALVAAKFCWRISRLAAILIAALIISLVLRMGVYSFGQRDFFMMLFLLLAMDQFAQFLEGVPGQRVQSSGKFLSGSGLAMGAAMSIKPVPIVLLAGFLGIIFLRPFLQKRDGQAPLSKRDTAILLNVVIRQALLLCSGSIVIPAVFAIWLLFTGGLEPFFEIMLQYILPIYSGLNRQDMQILLRKLFTALQPIWVNIPFLLFGLITIRGKLLTTRLWLADMAFLYGCCHFLLQGKGWDYQAMPFLMTSLLLQTVIFGVFMQKKLVFQSMGLLWVLTVVLINGSGLMNLAPISNQPLSDLKPAVPLLVDDLRSLGSSSTDRVQVMDVTGGGIHALFLLGQRLSTRYIYDFPLINNTDTQYVQKMQKEIIANLTNSQPIWIVVFAEGWEQQDLGLQRFKDFPQFIEFLNNHYHPAVEHQFYTIYQRNP